MDNITVKKSELLAKLQKNRISHSAEYDEACKNYHKMVIEKLQELLSAATNGDPLKSPKLETMLHLSVPVHQLDDYDRVISMLEMDIDDDVELDSNEFSQYVLDKWHWSSSFTSTTAFYNG